MSREQWFLVNLTANPISVGDLPQVPSVPPRQQLDLLTYTTKEEINQSSNLVELINAKWIRLTKKLDNSLQTSVTNKAEFKKETESIERGEVGSSGAIILGGEFDSISLPLTNIGSELIPNNTVLTKFMAQRGTAGSSGTTTIQLELNGNAISNATLSWDSTDKDFALKIVNINVEVMVGDRISFRMTSKEIGASDIFAVVN